MLLFLGELNAAVNAFAADQQQSSLTEVLKDRCKHCKSTPHIVAELSKHCQGEHSGQNLIARSMVHPDRTQSGPYYVIGDLSHHLSA